MSQRQYLILGGGISGLSAAWFLQKKDPNGKIVLLEKSERLGGMIQTKREGNLHFELGPRTFSEKRSEALLALIYDLGLGNELLFSDEGRRYIWDKKQLRSIGSFVPALIPLLFRERFLFRKEIEDESIYDFAARRFNPKIAETLFDPLTLGIFAGDIRKLSVRSCFPAFYENQGRLWKLFCKNKKDRLFTLRGGMEQLIEELKRRLAIECHYNTKIEEIQDGSVIANGKVWHADQIFSALPAFAIGQFLNEEFTFKSIWVVNLLFEEKILQKKGFGYLNPTQNQEPLLGMVWDSSIFPTSGTILTAMLREETADPIESALGSLRQHLKIGHKPNQVFCQLIQNAIPQFEVGYWKKIGEFQKRAKALFPKLALLGNYFDNPSVNSCIQRSYNRIESF